jgi:uncharacterized membrane protein YozB (DUF420 family)
LIYSLVLVLHSLTRWLVIILGLAALFRAFSGWFGRKAWTAQDNRLGMYFTSVMDLQLLLGLLLYIFLSPFTQSAFGNFGAAMRDRILRFWSVEHITAMLVAVALVHVGRVLSRRAPVGVAKHRRAAIFFGIAMLMVFLAIPWPFLSYGRPLLRFR